MKNTAVEFVEEFTSVFLAALIGYVVGALIGVPAFFYGYEFMNPFITGAVVSAFAMWHYMKD